MSAQMYEPLRAVPPLTDNHVKMDWLLRVRRGARAALDAALAVPRNAAVYVSRLIQKLHLDSAASWLRRATARLAQPLRAASSMLGWTGWLASVTGLATSSTGRAAMKSGGRLLGKVIGWTARKTYSGVDRVLRCFGKVGNKVADKLFAGVVSLGGKIATVATPVVHRVARLSEPNTAQARALSGICRSYVIHKLLKGFIGNAWLRLLIELVVLPACLDSRLLAWVRGALAKARARTRRPQEQGQVPADLEGQPEEGDQLVLIPDVMEDVHAVTTMPQEPVPSNRAERRAAQRARPAQR